MNKPKILFENDSRHTLIYMYEQPINKEEQESAIDELLGTPVDALLFNMGYGNAFLHGSNVGDRWGPDAYATEIFRPNKGRLWDHIVFYRAYRNAKKLIDEGNDPLHIICNRANDVGMLVYPTLQVQARADLASESHLTIGAEGDLDTNTPGVHDFDFKHEDVRNRRLKLIEETLNNYSVDGFELNLNHYAGSHFFRPDQIEPGRKIMNDWIREIHQAVKRSGNERELVVRIPASVDKCLSLGMDPEQWARDGIVDMISAESFSLSSTLDSSTDFTSMLNAVEGSKCRVHAVIRNRIGSDRLTTATAEMVRAVACNYWDQGVQGLTLAAWSGNWPYGGAFYEQLREIPYPEVMEVKDKFYFIPTESPDASRDETLDPGLAMQLPADLKLNKPVLLKMPISDDISRWGSVGRIHEVLLRVRIMRATELDSLKFRLNEQELPENNLRKIDYTYMMDAPRYRSHSSYWYVFKLDREHWPVNGSNLVEVTLLDRNPELTPHIYVRDVELEIKYLRGKSAHRGDRYTDPDLGPNDSIVK